MIKYPDGILGITVCFSEYDARNLSKEEMKRDIDYAFDNAKKKIEHELGLDDGTYELSQDIPDET